MAQATRRSTQNLRKISVLVCAGVIMSACSFETGTLATRRSTGTESEESVRTGLLADRLDQDVAASTGTETSVNLQTITSPLSAENSTTSDQPLVDPLFVPILDELAETSGVAPRLPADLALSAEMAASREVSATLVTSSEAGYDIVIGFGECPGGNACRVGTFAAASASVARTAPGGTGASRPSGAIPVPLPGGLSGEFFAATCGATCGDSTVQWEESGVIYTVGEKVGTSGRLIELAWQAIDPTATPPTPPELCGADVIRDGSRIATVTTDEVTGLTWVLVCSVEGTSSALAPGPGTLEWVEIDGDDSNDLELEVNGRSWLFTVSEQNQVYPLWGAA